MQVKPLTPTELSSIETLIKTRSRTLAVSPEFQDMHTKMTLLNVQDLMSVGPEVGQVFGAFDDEGLMIGILIVVLSSSQPCYFVRKAYTVPKAPLKTLSKMFEFIIQFYEKLGYKRFYTMYNADDIGLYHRLWRTGSTLRNYITYTDLTVPANVRPKHSDVWELLFGRSLYPEPMVVRAFIRKDDTMFLNETYD